METVRFKTDNYIHVPGFAIVEYGLSGNDLLCYSLIYGFTQDGETEFSGSLSYIASALNVTKQNAKKVLDRLIEKGLIDKKENYINNVKFCRYVSNRPPVAESATPPVIETVTPPVAEIATNNNSHNNSIDNNIPAGGGLFQDQPEFQPVTVTRPRRTSEQSCLFANSKFNELSIFMEEFKGPEFEGIDIVYYYHAVADWSAQKGKKMRDWIATTRNFIRSDMERKKLHKLSTGDNALSQEAQEYLREMSLGL